MGNSYGTARGSEWLAVSDGTANEVSTGSVSDRVQTLNIIDQTFHARFHGEAVTESSRG